jgi:hypothetical protein
MLPNVVTLCQEQEEDDPVRGVVNGEDASLGGSGTAQICHMSNYG